MIRCQNKYTSICKNQKSCPQIGDEKCHKPFPPRMTDIEFAEKQTEKLNELPEEFRGVVSSMAWDHGHSAGYEEVMMYVNEFTDVLLPAINSFKKTLTN